jgi:hypothetical protein
MKLSHFNPRVSPIARFLKFGKKVGQSGGTGLQDQASTGKSVANWTFGVHAPRARINPSPSASESAAAF